MNKHYIYITIIQMLVYFYWRNLVLFPIFPIDDLVRDDLLCKLSALIQNSAKS